MAQQLKVFVSHSHEDDVFCREIVGALRGAGADVWYDEQTRVWYNKGNALNALNRHEEALDAYDRALALEPKYVNAWTNKAIALRALGRTAEAEQAERRARELG